MRDHRLRRREEVGFVVQRRQEWDRAEKHRKYGTGGQNLPGPHVAVLDAGERTQPEDRNDIEEVALLGERAEVATL
jgi:hypothetical protein